MFGDTDLGGLTSFLISSGSSLMLSDATSGTFSDWSSEPAPVESETPSSLSTSSLTETKKFCLDKIQYNPLQLKIYKY